MTCPLPKRNPGQALNGIAPKDHRPPQLGLFNVGTGHVVVSSFQVARLHRIRVVENDPEPET
ncbi:hypothetical protein [Streptomyces sp. NPDC055099]